jgi:hypothetical protein
MVGIALALTLVVAPVQAAATEIPQLSIDQIDVYEGRMVRVCGSVSDSWVLEESNAKVMVLRDTGSRSGYLVAADKAREAIERDLQILVGSRVCMEGRAFSDPKFRAVHAFGASQVQLIPQASQPQAPPTPPTAGPVFYTDTEAATLLLRLQQWIRGEGPSPRIDYSRATPSQMTFFRTALLSGPRQVPPAPPPQPATPAAQQQSPTPRQRSDRTAQLLLGALHGFNAGYRAYTPPTTIASPTYTRRSRIDRVTSGGEVVTLLDGSVWIVNELDRIKSTLWSYGEISVIKGSRYGEYLLVRPDRGDSVRATAANP